MRSCSLRGCLDVGAPTSSSGRAHQQRTRSRAARVLCGAAQGVRDENGAALPGPAVLSSPRSLLPRWLPTPPDLRGAPPRAWSPAALAFMGDTVWELYARRYFFAPARLHATYVTKVSHCTRAEAQAAVVHALADGGHLSDSERAIVKWGRNAQTGKVPERLRANGGVYRDATSLEVLIGYLYVSDQARLDFLMERVGWEEPIVADWSQASRESPEREEEA